LYGFIKGFINSHFWKEYKDVENRVEKQTAILNL